MDQQELTDYTLQRAKAKLRRQADILENASLIADMLLLDDFTKPENLTAYIDDWDWWDEDVLSISFTTKFSNGIDCDIEIHEKHIIKFIIEYLARTHEGNRAEIYKKVEEEIKKIESET